MTFESQKLASSSRSCNARWSPRTPNARP